MWRLHIWIAREAERLGAPLVRDDEENVRLRCHGRVRDNNQHQEQRETAEREFHQDPSVCKGHSDASLAAEYRVFMKRFS